MDKLTTARGFLRAQQLLDRNPRIAEPLVFEIDPIAGIVVPELFRLPSNTFVDGTLIDFFGSEQYRKLCVPRACPCGDLQQYPHDTGHKA